MFLKPCFFGTVCAVVLLFIVIMYEHKGFVRVLPYMRSDDERNSFTPGNKQVEDRLDAVLQRLRKRAKTFRKACNSEVITFYDETDKEKAKRQMHSQLYVNTYHQLMYMGFPKIGSSFWKRVFKVLDKSNKDGVKMFDIPNMLAHRLVPKSMIFLQYQENDKSAMLEHYTKFFFVRDPYSRLFSAYVDKLYLPNDVGVNIQHQMIVSGNLKKLSCSWNVTFSALCQYVASTVLKRGTLDPHLKPVHIFHPCGLNVTYLGKMETFDEDSRAILESRNISINQITGDIADLETENELGYIKDITQRTFDFLYSWKPNCIQRSEVLFRLWTVFQIRGYIPQTSEFPFSRLQEGLHDISIDDFISAASNAYKQDVTFNQRHRQRETAMLEAYSLLSEDTLQQLEKALRADCYLFDYPCDIKDKVKTGHSKRNELFYFKGLN